MRDKFRRTTILATSAVMVGLLAGCGGGSGNSGSPGSGLMGSPTGTMDVRIARGSQPSRPRFVLDASVTSVTVTVVPAAGSTQTQTLGVTGGTTELDFTFTAVPVGTAQINVVASNSNGVTVDSGSGSVVITAGTNTPSTITLAPVNNVTNTATAHLFVQGTNSSNQPVLFRLDGLPSPTATTAMPAIASNAIVDGLIEANQSFDTVTAFNLNTPNQILEFLSASTSNSGGTLEALSTDPSLDPGIDLIQVSSGRLATSHNTTFSVMDASTGTVLGTIAGGIGTGLELRQDSNLTTPFGTGIAFVLDQNHNVNAFAPLSLATLTGNQTQSPVESATSTSFQPIGIDYDPANVRLYVLVQNQSNANQFGVFVLSASSPLPANFNTPTFTFTINGIDETSNIGKIAADVPLGATDAANLVVFVPGGVLAPVVISNPDSLTGDQSSAVQPITTPAGVTVDDISVEDVGPST